jgi:hypothetical protein
LPGRPGRVAAIATPRDCAQTLVGRHGAGWSRRLVRIIMPALRPVIEMVTLLLVVAVVIILGRVALRLIGRGAR